MSTKVVSKVLSIVLSLALALGMLPFMAMAIGGGDAVSVNDIPYPSLAAAFEAVPEGVETTVLLTDDIVVGTADIATLPAGKNIILDMAGHSITAAVDFEGRPIMNYGTMKVIGNGTIDTSASIYGGYGAINNYGDLTIENGVFAGHIFADGSAVRNSGGTLVIHDGDFTGCAALYNAEGAEATINGGYFHTTSCNKTVDDNGNNHWSYAFNSAGTLTFNAGTVEGVQGGLGISSGSAVINGGTFRTVACEHSSTGTASFYALYVAGEIGNATAVVKGGEYTSASRWAAYIGNSNPGGDGGNMQEATVQIEGGVFNSGDPNGYVLKVDADLANPSIIGGSYNKKPDLAPEKDVAGANVVQVNSSVNKPLVDLIPDDVKDQLVSIDTSGDKNTSIVIALKETEKPTLTGSDVAVDYGTAATLTVTASNRDPIYSYTYEWYEGTEATGTPIAQADAASFQAPADLTLGNHSYTVKVTGTRSDNGDSDFSTKTFTVTVNALTMEYTASGVDQAYDSNAYGITVNVTKPANGYTILYGTKPDACNLNQSPAYSDVGNYTVYFVITAPNYTTVTGSQTVKISSAGTLAAPTASPAAGTYNEAQNVTLTSEQGAEIYYTLDGSAPSVSSTKYTEAIPVSANTTIKAIAVKNGWDNSAAATLEYIIRVAPAADDLTYTLADVPYDKQAKTIQVTGAAGMGDITVRYLDADGEPVAEPVHAGVYTVVADIAEGTLYQAAQGLELGTFTIQPKTLTNVSVSIPSVKQDSAAQLTDQTLNLTSPDLIEGDTVGAVCDITLGSTAQTGDFTDASVTVKSLDNADYAFDGTVEGQSYTVTAKTLQGITITTAPTKTEYYEGETFDKTGMVVKAQWDSGDDTVVEDYTFAPNAPLTTADTKITVTYGDQTAEQPITVRKVEPIGIAITTPPTKTHYQEGEGFDAAGMKVELSFSDGTKNDVTAQCDFPDGALVAGTTKITVSYIAEGGAVFTAEQSITVTALATSSSTSSGSTSSADTSSSSSSSTSSTASSEISSVVSNGSGAVSAVSSQPQGTESSASSQQTVESTDNPKTGDTAQVLLWAMVLLLGTGVLAVLAASRKSQTMGK